MGGPTNTKNSVCACFKCNQEKGTTNWETFITQFNAPLREQILKQHIH